MVTRQPCQCQRWPERCWAAPAGTRGLCPVCMPGNCERPRPVTPDYADVTHKAPGTGARSERIAAVLNDPHASIRWPS